MVLLTIILFGVLGFLIMYFTRRIVLNIVLADSRNELEAKLRDIRTVKEFGPMTLAETPEYIPAEIRDEIRDAVERLASDKIERPLEEYEGLLAQGIALKLKGNLKTAINYLERASRANPTNYRPLTLLASAYFDLADIQTAYAYICKAEKLKSQELDPAYLKIYAEISYAAGENKKAIEYYSQYLKGHPNDAQARFKFAMAYARYGADNDDADACNNAIAALAAAVKRDSSLRSQAIQETKAAGAFEHLSNNDGFKGIVGMAQAET